jgi:hypothetical protein
MIVVRTHIKHRRTTLLHHRDHRCLGCRRQFSGLKVNIDFMQHPHGIAERRPVKAPYQSCARPSPRYPLHLRQSQCLHLKPTSRIPIKRTQQGLNKARVGQSAMIAINISPTRATVSITDCETPASN